MSIAHKQTWLATTAFLLLVSCAGHVVHEPQLLTTSKRTPRLREGDTTTYIVRFQSKMARREFRHSFDSLLATYRFDTASVDSTARHFVLSLVHMPDDAKLPGGDTIAPIEEIPFTEESISTWPDTALDTSTIQYTGGSITLHAERGFLTYPISQLISVDLFSQGRCHDSLLTGAADQAPCPLLIEQVSPTAVTISLARQVIQGGAKELTALDLVQAWTEMIARHPAEGLALFRHVKGIHRFIRGEEAIIPGFAVRNRTQIAIILERPDPLAIERLSSWRLLPHSVRAGPYVVTHMGSVGPILAGNPTPWRNRALLDTCILVLAGDRNPLVSFSLGRYDVLELTRARDLSYARRQLADASLTPLAGDRYFLSLASRSRGIRQLLADQIDPKAIWSNSVRAEGGPIEYISSPPPTPGMFTGTGNQPHCEVTEPVRILFAAQDPVSTSIAEKILSILSRGGIPAKLLNLVGTDYERALVTREYEIAVGWVSDRVLWDRAEQLRVATIWFADLTEEARRLDQLLELPLFSVNRHLLCKKHVGLHKNRITGLYIKRDDVPNRFR